MAAALMAYRARMGPAQCGGSDVPNSIAAVLHGTQIQSHTGIIELLVSLDSEVRV